MKSPRLLYISAHRATLYERVHGTLRERGVYGNNEEGVESFAAQVAREPHALYHVLCDVVEEDFQVETIPFVRGADRRALLDRRLAQRYRDSSLATTMSLGFERSQRREERVLLSAFSNTERLELWLLTLEQYEANISGIYTPGLLAPELARLLGYKSASLLIVSVHQAGLRQTYLENGKLRFSRLSPLSAEELADPDRVASALGNETGRIYQYLRATNILGREHPPVDVLMLAPPGSGEQARDFVPPLAQVEVHIIDQAQAAARVGLSASDMRLGGEAIFLHLLAKKRPPQQYGSSALRAQYRLHRTRLGLMFGGAVLGLALLLAAAALLFESYGLRQQIANDQMQIQQSNQRYAQIATGFPALPTTPDNFRAGINQYIALTRLGIGPERFAVDLSGVLERSPRVELMALKWRVANDAGKDQPADSATSTPARFESAEISARLTGVNNSDYRAATELINDFADKLSRLPGVRVLDTRMPFDTDSQTSLSSELGRTNRDDALRFSVTVARKVGA